MLLPLSLSLRCLLSAAMVLVLLGPGAWLSRAEGPGVHTDRKAARLLPLPKGDDVFHFVVFGDRTGGPAEGIRVLAQAVEDANLLDPDLVMTVGDLVNGYNQSGPWLKQMEEYRETMGRLRMPWFPVAGNHDVYWRAAATNAEPRPPRDHEERYEKHFGPLWYWFEHKKTGFLTLFSDEAPPDGRVRDYSDPEQQKISRQQLEWLGKALGEMRHLRHVFVFLHHPLWWSERYRGNNWDEVHRLLVQSGNVRAVLAGHIHQLRYDGVRDGIGYYALATTGGSLPAGVQHEYFGYLHHFNVVTVRDGGFTMAAVPVGAVFDPRQFTPARHAEVEAARSLLPEFVSPPLAVAPSGAVAGLVRLAVTNPCTLPIEVTFAVQADATWSVAPDHRHARLGPEEGQVFEFACTRDASRTLEGLEGPEFQLSFDVLTPEARLALPARGVRARTRLVAPPGGWPAPATNGVAVFDGKAACLEIPVEDFAAPEGPFTVEAWVRPADDKDGGLVSNLKLGGFSLDVAGTPRFSVPGSLVPFTGRGKAPAAVAAKAKDKLARGRWTHLAGVYDGARIVLYVNGREAAATPVPAGARVTSDKSLYVGARPSPAGNLFNLSQPAGFWAGAIDDVRLSRGARYTGPFTPGDRLLPDLSTLVALDMDQAHGPFVPWSSSLSFQAWRRGEALVRPEPR